ncbi:MAG: glutamyl-tRNA reductase [Gemmatimonadaceae bacterium]
MQLLAVGLNHHTAPLALRERIAVTGDGFAAALAGLGARVTEGFVLSTCNRTEYYAVVGHTETGAAVLRDVLRGSSGLSAEELDEHLEVYVHEDAVSHLFRIAAGIESMVPGEDQILAQIKATLEAASRAGVLGATTHRLGASALAAGKRVRAETGISRHSLSVVSVALQLGCEELGSIADRRIVIVGAGSTAELALKQLAGRGAADIRVSNRTGGRAKALAERYGVSAIAWESLSDALADADLVISCTSSQEPVIEVEMLSRGERAATAPVVVFDLAVPRDVAPAAADLSGVMLWDIDGLQAICDENRARRAAEIASAEAIAESECARFMTWWSARQLAPTISALVDHAENIRDAELDRLLTRLPDLSEREEQLVRAFASRVVNKLLHQPLKVLKEDPEGANMAQVVQALFGLSPQGAEPAEEIARVSHSGAHICAKPAA